MGNSKLDNYIQKLLSDDQVLDQFIQNPIASETLHGLTKAERSVLRRVFQHVPATAKSGFSGVRSYSSYRRSLRLIQNVLHHSASSIHSNIMVAESDVEVEGDSKLTTGSQNGGTFYLYVYYPSGGSANYTCKNNHDIDAIGGPYANWFGFRITFGSGSTSVERLLLGASQAFPQYISYETVNGKNGLPYVSEINIVGNAITADLSNACYDLKKNPNADSVFWFYSINGTPNHGGANGAEGTSFSQYLLNDGDTVFWQLIAPDKQYGFNPCY